ncbi:hypothetical protein EST38_g3311 [Candolleomyces aberdarensis]|uniref:Uncharacterized protein n=1 Tax=Candolleomyces aberdarensis TaxID=2316362 RepID=A0A4Q2DQQ9_9AGAR|nr:hypothetical protein EST38_g3311 [Candolleomyces aberdarensis]
MIRRSACFAAKDALEHLATRQLDIIQAIQSPQVVVLAGFNEDLLDGVVLLQEIHIFCKMELNLKQLVLDQVGKIASPFPSEIFLPSGKSVSPPVFDVDGNPVRYDRVTSSSAFEWRYSDAMERGLAIASAPAEDEESDDDDMIRNGSTGGRTRPQVRFDVVAKVHQPMHTLVQDLRLTGALSFESIPKKTVKVQFKQMKCQTYCVPGLFQFSQTLLKILVDTEDPLWGYEEVQPRTQRSLIPRGKRSRTKTPDKTAVQRAYELLMAYNPFKVGSTGQSTVPTERFYPNERILLTEGRGRYEWLYNINDWKPLPQDTVDLVELDLPLVELKYFPYGHEKPHQLTVEVSSVWSLNQDPKHWSPSLIGDCLTAPGYSNLCQHVFFDLSSEDLGDGTHAATLNVSGYPPGALPFSRVNPTA